jgi:hypothetical protein
VIQLGDAYWLHESTNVWAFRHGNSGTGIGIQHALPRLLWGAGLLFRRVFVAPDVALPVLTTAGLVGLFAMREHRAFLAALWVLQLGLVVLLAASGAHLAGTTHDVLRARRYLLVETVSLVALLSAARTAPSRLRLGLSALLLIGNAWSLVHLARFMRSTRPPQYSLPAVESVESVGWIDRAAIAWAEGLAGRVLAGERVVVLHSQHCPSENFTNPAGTLERIYLTVGHARFVESVLALPTPRCRYACLPLRSMEATSAELGRLEPEQAVDLDTTCAGEMKPALALLRSRFALVTANPGERFARFVVRPKPATSPP